MDVNNDPENGGSALAPAVPSAGGVADVFAYSYWPVPQFSAITADGVTAWSSGLYFFAADFQGGALALTPDPDASGDFDGTTSLVRLDGTTGQPVFTHSYSQSEFMWAVPHPDGTIFLLEYDNVWGGGGPNDGYFTLKGLDPATGSEKWSIPFPSGAVLNDSDDWADPSNPEGWGHFAIAGDGYAYVPYAWGGGGAVSLMLARVSSSGEYTQIPIADTPSDDLAWSIMTNADQGVLFTWADGECGVSGAYAPAGCTHMAITSGTSVQTMNGALIGAQAGPVIPWLQAQDGSFVGTAREGMDGDWQEWMVTFDASGGVHGMVPNMCPLIATDDGGVIAQASPDGRLLFDYRALGYVRFQRRDNRAGSGCHAVVDRKLVPE